MPSRSRDYDLFAVVAVGGSLGALVRYSLDVLIAPERDGWPTATFVINLTGAFVLGVVLVVARVKVPDPKASTGARLFRPFVVTGLLGGYTTFSTYVIETHTLALAGRWILAVTYAVGSVVLGVVCVAAAMFVTTRILEPVPEPIAVEELAELEAEDFG